MTLPSVVEALFLGRNGLLGYRCACGFVITARSMTAFEQGLIEHRQYRHPVEDAADAPKAGE